jgi:DNA-directed RNA polymerase specialized sigma24 family protein
MSDIEAVTAGLREAYARFATAVATIRPALHRYCSRMTGSVLIPYLLADAGQVVAAMEPQP